ncbi:hypothetical protein TWF481_010831 [Arthrobotrys musiformis]|uniref:Uncharacterized protein n=1 Tax=Arthrobotrys musiformis TaxID=47236 RepID=A0AAV9W7T8_9PEZI
MFDLISFGRSIFDRYHLEHFPKKQKREYSYGPSLSLLPFRNRRKRFSQLPSRISSASASQDDVSEPQNFLSDAYGPEVEKALLETLDIDHLDPTKIYRISSSGRDRDIGIPSIPLSRKAEAWLAETLPPDACFDEKWSLIAQDNLEILLDFALVFYRAGKQLIGENATSSYPSSDDIKSAITASMLQLTRSPEFREKLFQQCLGTSYTQAAESMPDEEMQPGERANVGNDFRIGVGANTSTVTQGLEQHPFETTHDQPSRTYTYPRREDMRLMDKEMASPQLRTGSTLGPSAPPTTSSQGGSKPRGFLSSSKARGDFGQARIPGAPAQLQIPRIYTENPAPDIENLNYTQMLKAEPVGSGPTATGPQTLGINSTERGLEYISTREARPVAPRVEHTPSPPAQNQAQLVAINSPDIPPQSPGRNSSGSYSESSQRFRSPPANESTAPALPQYEDTQFYDAVRRDNLSTIHDLLKNGFDIFKESTHTTVAHLPANAIAYCVKYRKKDVLSCFINHNVKCYPTAIWEALRYGDEELREFITEKYEERRHQLDLEAAGTISYCNDPLELELCENEPSERYSEGPSAKASTQDVSCGLTLRQFSEDPDDNIIYTAGSSAMVSTLPRSGSDVEGPQEHYGSGPGASDDEKESEGYEGEKHLDEGEGVGEYDEDCEFEWSRFQPYTGRSKFEGYDSEGSYASDDGGPPECVDGGESTGTLGRGRPNGGSRPHENSNQPANRVNKRPWSQGEEENGDDGYSDNPPPKKPHSHDANDTTLLPCPFFILDQNLHSCCRRILRQNLSGMKEHLKRNHFGGIAPPGLYDKKRIRTWEDLRQFCERNPSSSLETSSSTQPTLPLSSPLPSVLSDGISIGTAGVNLHRHADSNTSFNLSAYTYPNIDNPASGIAIQDIKADPIQAVQGVQSIGLGLSDGTLPSTEQGTPITDSSSTATAQYAYMPYQAYSNTLQGQLASSPQVSSTQQDSFLIAPANAQVLEGTMAESPHNNFQGGLAKPTLLYGQQPARIPPDNATTQDISRISEALTFRARMLRNGYALAGQWRDPTIPHTINASRASIPPAIPRTLTSSSQPKTNSSAKMDTPSNASQTYMPTNPHLLHGIGLLNPPNPPSEGGLKTTGNLLPPRPAPPPLRPPSTASSSSSLLLEVNKAINQSSQGSNEMFPAGWRPADLGPGNIIPTRNKTSTAPGSGSPSLLSLRHQTSTAITPFSEAESTAATPRPLNLPFSPPELRASGDKEYTIMIRLKPPQKLPHQKRWRKLFVNDADELKREFDDWIAEQFPDISFSWDSWDLQNIDDKERKCDMGELVMELEEMRWPKTGYRETTTKFFLLPKVEMAQA